MTSYFVAIKPGKLSSLYFLLVFVSLSQAAQAQVKNTAFDLMLRGIYHESIPLISAEQMLEANQFVLLDTREAKEYKVSHIPGSKWVGYNDFTSDRVAQVSFEDTVVVYCSIGYRSERIGEQLLELGYKNVFNLYGGIFDWVNRHNEVVNTKDSATTRVHGYSKVWGIWLDDADKVYE